MACIMTSRQPIASHTIAISLGSSMRKKKKIIIAIPQSVRSIA